MILVFACVIIGHQLVFLLMRRRFDPFDVRTLIDVVLLTMWVYAPLTDRSLRFSLENDLSFSFTTLLGIVSLYIGLHLPIWKRQTASIFQSRAPILHMQWLWLTLFLASTLLLTYQKIQLSSGDIWGYLTGDRLSAYQVFLTEEYRGSISGRIISFTQPILLLWLAIALERKRWMQASLLYLVLFAGIVLIATVRLPIIILLLIPVYYYYRSRNRPVTIPATLICVSVFVLLMFVLNIWRSSGLRDIQNIDFSGRGLFNSIELNFNPIRGYEKLWQMHANGQMHYEYGLTYLYVPLTAIPRALWQNKPQVSMEARWTTYLFGQHFAVADEGWGVWTFTVWGEGLVQFGVVGIFLNLFLYGILIAWMENKIGRSPRFSLIWFYYSILAATYLRSSFTALAWTILWVFLALGIFYYSSAKIRKPNISRCHQHLDAGF